MEWSLAQAHGRSSGDEPLHRRGGENLEEGKAQEGLGRRAMLTPLLDGTDSQGEQSREVGQRHLHHLLGVAAWCAGGPAILGDGSATAGATARRHRASEELTRLLGRGNPWREKPKGVSGVK
jgi:hypothetical protein